MGLVRFASSTRFTCFTRFTRLTSLTGFIRFYALTIYHPVLSFSVSDILARAWRPTDLQVQSLTPLPKISFVSEVDQDKFCSVRLTKISFVSEIIRVFVSQVELSESVWSDCQTGSIWQNRQLYLRATHVSAATWGGFEWGQRKISTWYSRKPTWYFVHILNLW